MTETGKSEGRCILYFKMLFSLSFFLLKDFKFVFHPPSLRISAGISQDFKPRSSRSSI